jgi:hypothetical protein
MTPELDPDRRRDAWKWALHEDNLFDSRLQVFLTAHAILIMAAGFAVQKDQPSKAFLLFLAALGLVLGLVWMIVQLQSCRIVEQIENNLDDDEMFVRVFNDLERAWLFRYPRNVIMTWVLPPVMLLWWCVFSVFVMTGDFNGSPG